MEKQQPKNVVYLTDDVIRILPSDIGRLKALAQASPNRRARFCLHKGPDDKLHEMVIAFMRDTYIRPHMHPAKTESFHMIEGSIRLFVFDASGKVVQSFVMSAEDPKACFLYRIAPGFWHTLVPLTDIVVLHEVTNGPFTGDSKYADWAPEEKDSKAVREYVATLSSSRP